MDNKITITLGASIILCNVIDNILNERVKDENGKYFLKERSLPFRLRYRLTRSRVPLEKDIQYVESKKMVYLAELGEPSEDGKNVVINSEENLKKYNEYLYDLLSTKVEHYVMKTEIEDIDTIKDCIDNIDDESMKLFIGYLTNDENLVKDIESKITSNH